MTGDDDRDLAVHYDETGDVSDFEGPAESISVRRDVTISVRFSDKEIETLRARADAADEKVTAFIRMAALEATLPPLDRPALSDSLRRLERELDELRGSVGEESTGAPRSGTFEIYRTGAGFRFRLRAASGDVMATSEQFASKAAAQAGVRSMQRMLFSRHDVPA